MGLLVWPLSDSFSSMSAQQLLEQLAVRFGLSLVDGMLPVYERYVLCVLDNVLQLQPLDNKQGGALCVDFDAASQLYRREQSGIRQDIARAVGCKPGYRPAVLDATAGLGADASLLAFLGCPVDLLEQNPVVYTLLADGLRRAGTSAHAATCNMVSRLQLQGEQDAVDYMQTCCPSYDVVYLDPMFPQRQKSAKVKKAMQYLHDVAGIASDEKHEQLLVVARSLAVKRVVVKRPRLAPCLSGLEPDYQLTGKTIRYDVYLSTG